MDNLSTHIFQVEEITCPHCSNVIVPPRSSGIASFSQQIAALASASASVEVNNLREKEMISNSSEGKSVKLELLLMMLKIFNEK